MDREILCRILQPRVERFDQIPEMAAFLAKLDESYPLDMYTNKNQRPTPR